MSVNASTQLRHVFSVMTGATPPSGNDEYWDGNILWITPEDLSDRRSYWLENTRRKITDAGYGASGTSMAPAHSIVLSKRAPIGQLAVLKEPACSNQGCLLLVPRVETDPRYFYYWLSNQTEYLKALGRGSTFKELSADDLKSIRVPDLPKTRQSDISDYLDRETAHLDALVLEKERILNLLVEKRQTLIAHAVTRGIDPDVSFRNSGVTWLGDIPVHWEIERARWLFNERDERSSTGCEELLTVSHLTGVTPRSEKQVNMFEAQTTEGYKKCLENDLVINALWAWMGALGVTPLNGIVSPSYHVYELATQRLIPGFVDALVRLSLFAQEVTRYSKGVWSSRLRLYPQGFFEVFLPVPPRKEQQEILMFIQEEQRRLEDLMAEAKRAIALLKERRAAVIAAAVVGQM